MASQQSRNSQFREGNSGCYSSSYHQSFSKSSWIVIRRISCKGMSEGDLAMIFSQFGEVIDVRCPRHRRSGELQGIAFIQFQSPLSAVLACDNMNSFRGVAGSKMEPIPVYLSEECRSTGNGGIEVDHCDEREVPPLGTDTETYGEWYRREMLGEMSTT